MQEARNSKSGTVDCARRHTFLSPISLRYFFCARVTQNLALRSYHKLWQTATLSFVLLRQVFATNGTWNLSLEMEITIYNPLRVLSNTRFKFRSREYFRTPILILRFLARSSIVSGLEPIVCSLSLFSHPNLLAVRKAFRWEPQVQLAG